MLVGDPGPVTVTAVLFEGKIETPYTVQFDHKPQSLKDLLDGLAQEFSVQPTPIMVAVVSQSDPEGRIMLATDSDVQRAMSRWTDKSEIEVVPTAPDTDAPTGHLSPYTFDSNPPDHPRSRSRSRTGTGSGSGPHRDRDGPTPTLGAFENPSDPPAHQGHGRATPQAETRFDGFPLSGQRTQIGGLVGLTGPADSSQVGGNGAGWQDVGGEHRSDPPAKPKPGQGNGLDAGAGATTGPYDYDSDKPRRVGAGAGAGAGWVGMGDTSDPKLRYGRRMGR